MKIIFLLIITIVGIGSECFAQEKDLKHSMYVKLETTVRISERFDELRVKHASNYRIDMVIVDRAQMDVFANQIFGGGSTIDSDSDQNLYGIMRIYINAGRSFDFIAHHLDISTSDDDLVRNGFSTLRIGFCRPDEVFYKIFKFEVYSKEREKLLNKKKVEFLIDWLGFG